MALGIKGLTGLTVFLLLIVSLIGCASGHCRKATPITGQVITPEAAVDKKGKVDARKVLVYKYDGSLQCGMGKALPLDIMSREFGEIKIFSQKKKPDGLMHIQMCGAPTGMANVYEISEAELGKAETLGFKTWSFD